MRNLSLKLFVNAQSLLASLKKEEGQDLVEYALVLALIALAATAGMRTLANGINNAMSSVASTLSSNIA